MPARAVDDFVATKNIANGVTGVRVMFGPLTPISIGQSWRRSIAPHIYLDSPIVDGKPPVWPDSIALENADEARKVVDEHKQDEADFIKVYSLLRTRIVFSPLSTKPTPKHACRRTCSEQSSGRRREGGGVEGILSPLIFSLPAVMNLL